MALESLNPVEPVVDEGVHDGHGFGREFERVDVDSGGSNSRTGGQLEERTKEEDGGRSHDEQSNEEDGRRRGRRRSNDEAQRAEL